MTDLERFKAVVHFEKPDYVPIFGFDCSGFAHGTFRGNHQRLVETGMPETVGGDYAIGEPINDSEGWQRYWGTTTPIFFDLLPADPPKGIRTEVRTKGDYEIVESETGAVTRQLRDNAGVYGMPEFVRYDVRDRTSWQKYRDLMTPGRPWSQERIDQACASYDDRRKPLEIKAGGTWGSLRSLMGPELACTVLYDDRVLAHEILEWQDWKRRNYVFPLVDRLRPELIRTGEDICYKGGMLISPAHFEEFCAGSHRAIASVARDCATDLLIVDTDGNTMEFVPIIEALGVNGCFPFEVKAGNDLFALRERFPRFVMMGWLEKEVLNEGNEHLIRPEIESKVPRLLPLGGYFPSIDHSAQPLLTFENMCCFMTLLHETIGNPEGEFPRLSPP
jgi:hypothetical protein